MKILLPGSAASPRPLAPAVAVAGVATVPQEGENLVPAEEAPAGVVLGEPVVDRPFTVAAAVWDAAADDAVERVEIRVRQDGAWGPWQVLDRPVLPEGAAPRAPARTRSSRSARTAPSCA